MEVASLATLIRDAGLSNQKAPRILEILRRIREDFGSISLGALKGWSDSDVERYLVSLPGVGLKTAKCVMMYTFARSVLPVDTHVLRVSRRLGLIPKELPYSRAHEELEAVVRPEDRYRFHVNALSHGKVICQARRPRCHECRLRAICPFPSKGQVRSSKPPAGLMQHPSSKE